MSELTLRGNFFTTIRTIYDQEVTRRLKTWMNLASKYKRAEVHFKFLQDCRKWDVVPDHLTNIRGNIKHIQFGSTRINRKYTRALNSFSKKLLNLEIMDRFYELKTIKKNIQTIEQQLQKDISTDLLVPFYCGQQLRLNKIVDMLTNDKQKKLSKLYHRYHQNVTPIVTPPSNFAWFKNLTNKIIPPEVEQVVSLGNKFNLPNNNITEKDKVDIIKNVDANLYKQPPEDRNRIVQKVTSVVSSCMKKQQQMRHKHHFFVELENNLATTKTFVENNPEIMFTIADKGNVTVALEKSKYVDEVNKLLSDTTTYKLLTKNPLQKVIDDLKALLYRWRERTHIDDSQFYRLFLTSANLARAYALPKIHKPNNPFRIIVSSIGSPLHNLAGHLQRILSRGLSDNLFSIKNSLEFVDKVKHLQVPPNHEMISLDVSALFTSIPVDLILDSIQKKWSSIEPHYNITWNEIVCAINLVTSSTYFQFDDKIYQQVDGTPMGSPVSPTFAEYVMNQLEDTCLQRLDFKPVYYCRYVDDIFCIVPTNKINDMIEVFNNYHQKLKFTHERSVEGKISFLDTELTLENDKVSTNWYRKPTYSGRLLHYRSNNPISQKKAVVYNLVDKAILLSDTRFYSENLNIVRNILLQNHYPIKFINENIKKRFRHLSHNDNNNNNDNQNEQDRKNFIVLPYHSLTSKPLSNVFKEFQTETIFKNNNKLDSIVRKGKDKLPIFRQHNIVYRIDCRDCDSVYVGQTKRALETRLKEHRANIKLDRDKYNAVSLHRMNNNHDMKWDSPKILDFEHNKFKRDISEMVHIKINKNTLNVQCETAKLNDIYTSIL